MGQGEDLTSAAITSSREEFAKATDLNQASAPTLTVANALARFIGDEIQIVMKPEVNFQRNTYKGHLAGIAEQGSLVFAQLEDGSLVNLSNADRIGPPWNEVASKPIRETTSDDGETGLERY